MLVEEVAGLARQLFVVERLEPLDAFAVDVDEAQHLGSQRPGRIGPLGLLFEEDSRQLGLLERLDLGLFELPSQEHVPGVATEFLGEHVGIEVEGGRHQASRHDRVFDLAGVGDHRPGLDGDRQLTAVSVEDRSTIRGQQHLSLSLVECPAPVLFGFDDLDPEELESDADPGQHHDEAYCDDSKVGSSPPTTARRLTTTRFGSAVLGAAG